MDTKTVTNYTHQTGFQSPADDFLEKDIDLNEYLKKHQNATFFVRVETDCMVKSGYFPGDILIVDKSVHATHGSPIVAILNGEFVFKRLYKKEGRIFLVSANPKYKPIRINEESDFQIWGVVTSSIHYDAIDA